MRFRIPPPSPSLRHSALSLEATSPATRQLVWLGSLCLRLRTALSKRVAATTTEEGGGDGELELGLELESELLVPQERARLRTIALTSDRDTIDTTTTTTTAAVARGAAGAAGSAADGAAAGGAAGGGGVSSLVTGDIDVVGSRSEERMVPAEEQEAAAEAAATLSAIAMVYLIDAHDKVQRQRRRVDGLLQRGCCIPPSEPGQLQVKVQYW